MAKSIAINIIGSTDNLVRGNESRLYQCEFHRRNIFLLKFGCWIQSNIPNDTIMGAAILCVLRKFSKDQMVAIRTKM